MSRSGIVGLYMPVSPLTDDVRVHGARAPRHPTSRAPPSCGSGEAARPGRRQRAWAALSNTVRDGRRLGARSARGVAVVSGWLWNGRADPFARRRASDGHGPTRPRSVRVARRCPGPMPGASRPGLGARGDRQGPASGRSLTPDRDNGDVADRSRQRATAMPLTDSPYNGRRRRVAGGVKAAMLVVARFACQEHGRFSIGAGSGGASFTRTPSPAR